MSRFIFLFCFFMLVGCGSEAIISAEPTQPIPLPSSTPVVPAEPTLSPSPEPVEQTAIPSTSNADANVEFVRAILTGENTWTFHVTVAHPDTGWDDYADGWDVVLPDGSVIKPSADVPFTRLLGHPHENEQPFTRNQRGILIPDSITSVTVRAHDLVDGFGGAEVLVDLNSAEGENYKVEK